MIDVVATLLWYLSKSTRIFRWESLPMFTWFVNPVFSQDTYNSQYMVCLAIDLFSANSSLLPSSLQITNESFPFFSCILISHLLCHCVYWFSLKLSVSIFNCISYAFRNQGHTFISCFFIITDVDDLHFLSTRSNTLESNKTSFGD